MVGLAIGKLFLFLLTILSFFSFLIVSRDLARTRYGCDDQGVVRKLFLPSATDEHVLFAVSEDGISGLGTATVKNVWNVNVIVCRGRFVECYKHILIVHPMKKGTYRKWNSEMMKENGCR